ncbi:hypothetical protein [Pseudonocardia alni]|uniref:hypothetical protein n=1 Tax=Pseudonocardia alni TaxID=33907 RepID=UPI0033DA248D
MTTTMLRNHTPHPVTVVLVDGSDVDLPPHPPSPRVVVERSEDGELRTEHGAVALTRTRRSAEVVDLPAAESGVVLIVSLAVAQARPDRTDLVFPDRQIRDADGRIVACAALGRVSVRH